MRCDSARLLNADDGPFRGVSPRSDEQRGARPEILGTSRTLGSRSACRGLSRRVSTVRPIVVDVDAMAAHDQPCSLFYADTRRALVPEIRGDSRRHAPDSNHPIVEVFGYPGTVQPSLLTVFLEPWTMKHVTLLALSVRLMWKRRAHPVRQRASCSAASSIRHVCLTCCARNYALTPYSTEFNTAGSAENRPVADDDSAVSAIRTR